MRLDKPYLIAFFVLTASILACVNPPAGGSPADVGTIVAATLQALTPPAGAATEPPAGSLLPRSLYFLNNDAAGLIQVYRLEADGRSLTQVTFEPADVTGFDPSPLDGSVAYVSNNQLLVAAADGSERRLVLDGGVQDPNNAFLNVIRSPVWSPDGGTIAYGFKGLNLYSTATSQSNRVLEDEIDDVGGGFLVPREMFWPDKYSPDGGKLLVTLGYYEGASAAVYYPNGNALVRLKGGEGALICCGETEWTADGSAVLSASPYLGMYAPGMWRVDAASGNVTTLIAGDAGDGSFRFADEPLLAPDGRLYYFYAGLPAGQETGSRTPLQLVRSAADGSTDRETLRPETYELMNEALWAPDGSLVVVAEAPIQDVYQGGVLQIVYTDGSRPIVELAPFGMQMKWGP